MSSLNSPQKHCISNSKGNLHVFQHQRLIWPYHLGTVMLSKCPHISSTITLCGSQLSQKRHIFWINLGSDLYKLSLITSAQDSPLKMSRDPARASSLLQPGADKKPNQTPFPWKGHAWIRDAHPKKGWGKKEKKKVFSGVGRTMKMSSGFSGASRCVLSCLDMNGEKKNVFITRRGNPAARRQLDPITFPLDEGARNPNEAQ